MRAAASGSETVVARVAEILAGRYELLEVIGRGGMGLVYRGRDRVLERTVAVKVLPFEHAGNPILVERFSREARAIASLSHPNIVAVFDTGREAGARYLVMEFVSGASLAQLMTDRGSFAPTEAVDIAAQVASALAAAHRAGIIHRDIKPANVMVEPSADVKVLDFGIAHAAADPALTRTSMVLGSAPYIAPEMARGEKADERSDIYSLGCVLYELLTGRPPFTGELPEAVMSQHTSVAPCPPRELEPTVPAVLDALVVRMLAKRREDRPQTAAELVSELPASLREPSPPVFAAPTAPPPRTVAEASGSQPAPEPRRRNPRPWTWLAVAIVAVLAGLALALIAFAGGQKRPNAAPPPSGRAAPGIRTTTTSGGAASSSTTSSTTPRTATTPTATTSTATGTTRAPTTSTPARTSTTGAAPTSTSTGTRP
jgi:serine/threonine-protein kinase